MQPDRHPGAEPEQPSPLALPGLGVLLAAGGLVVLLVAVGGRYGFHRDELYFVEAGRRPAFGYPDSPPLVPLLAAVWHDLVGGSLWWFRLVPALASGALVLVAAATSRALGGSRGDQAWTAAATACSTTVIGVGHLFSTTTFDALGTAITVLLVIHAIHLPAADAAPWRSWLAVGIAAGLTLQVKTLVASVLLACVVGLVLAGPRRVLRRPHPWAAAALALAIAAPNLGWQAANGWPQLEMSRAIAAGSSGTSVDRWAVVPLQVTLTGLVVAPVLVGGVMGLLRSARLRPFRWLGVAYLVLLVIVVITGGKQYYTLGLLPVLLAAGIPGVRSAALARGPAIRRWLVPLVAVQVAVGALITLPVLPPRMFAGSPLAEAFYDTGEQLGWERLTVDVIGVASELPPEQRVSAIVLTANYGEGGALARARRRGGDLPPVFSGHNGFAWWGPPPDAAGPVIVLGRFPDADLARWFDGCRTAGTVDNGIGLDNEEQGAPIRVCGPPRETWRTLWPSVRHLR